MRSAAPKGWTTSDDIDGLKKTFADRLIKLMAERNWSQSDLARNAGLNRDAISTYVNAKSLPERKSMAALAKAFHIDVEDLYVGRRISNRTKWTIQQSPKNPNKVELFINIPIKVTTASKIIELIEADDDP